MADTWTPEEARKAIEKNPYLERYLGPVYAEPLIPEDLSKYPFVIACDDDTTAIVALNPKRGYIMLKNGRRTEPEPLEKLLDDTRMTIPKGAWRWAINMLNDDIKSGKVKKMK
jgi:hypothetical protein